MSLIIRHIGLYVSDLNRMIAFYKGILCLDQIYHAIEEGPVIDRMFGESDVKIDVCKLQTADGCILELIKSMNKDKNVTDSRSLYGSIRDLGRAHIALTVDNCSQTYNAVIDNGGTCLSEPIASADGKVFVFFARDPEGNYLEIVEERTSG